MMVKMFVMIILLLNPIISLMGVKSNRKLGLQREKQKLRIVITVTKEILCSAMPQ